MSFSDRTTTSRLMRTCRTLNHEGAKHLFKDTLWIANEASAISFTQYAFARANLDEMAHRMHWLNSLHVYAPRPRGNEVESIQRLSRSITFFLSHFAILAPNFVELNLHDSEELLSADTALAEVIGAMARLQKLILTGAGRQTSEMLRRSNLRLWSVEFETIDETVLSMDDHPMYALHNSQDTLRVLSLERVAFDPDRHLPCYNNLVQLELATSLVPPVHRLAQAFPNLWRLKINSFPGHSHLNAIEREEQHQTNVLGQAQHGTFPSLRSYKGSILSFYLLALTCRVPFIELRDDEHIPCWDTRMLQATCAHARPAHLDLYVSYLHDFLAQTTGFAQLCASEDFRRSVGMLTLTFDVFWGEHDFDLAPVLECVYLAVRASSLRAVELILDGQHLWEDCCDEDEEFPPVEVFLQSLDIEGVADKLLEKTETLKTVIVRLWVSEKPEVKVQRGPDINYSDII
ncbi:hypothetical protein GSI_15531 [Ganoderma sinense ZZ0214-1]|uniref:Uncharacterized protein n=1 Tax=Ganoderma sinense ZZ0214-1 TaxID=1077348 RepID=A0A2G8RMU7_9APHY|nr:hypothetical protein GSI_15531 [Ganoderma sinense ZZ0214-1]